MDILLKLVHNERYNVALLNGLARHNAALMGDRPDLPLLYESGVVYRRERIETWSDVVWTYRQGWEDCDALSAIRAGELIARGGQAMRPGDAGYERCHRLKAIHAEVFLETPIETPENGPGTYHCVTRYQAVLPGRARPDLPWFVDDPSLRLGMRGGMVDRSVLARWRRLGVRPGEPLTVE